MPALKPNKYGDQAMISSTARLDEQAKVVVGLAPITPSTTTPDAVSLKNYERCSIIITVDNGATVTGSAIGLLQATDGANTSGKTLAFTRMLANQDIGAGDTWVETAVTSNTFTTLTTDNKNHAYIIDVKASDLDVDGGFDFIAVTTGNAVNSVTSIIYVLYPARYAKAIQGTAVA
jgi:hypothetical protein